MTRLRWTACASCLPVFSCTPFDDVPPARRRRRSKALEISAPRALRPRVAEETANGRRISRWSFASFKRPQPESVPDRTNERYDGAQDGGGVPLTTLSADDLHLLETYQSRARAQGWRPGSPSTSRTDAPSHPGTPELEQGELGRRLHPVHSRDYISLRSGTPLSVRDQTPPPPPPKKPATTTRSPLSKQNPWAARRSIRRVGSFAEEESSTAALLFTPLPLELDFSPLDVQFERLVVDVSDEAMDRGESNDPQPSGEEQPMMPSRPKLVHFAKTPSRSRHDVEMPYQSGEDHRRSSMSGRSVTAIRMSPAPITRPRTCTPIRNAPRSPSTASAHSSTRPSSWTREIRSSIYHDLTPLQPSLRGRTRPDPALFPRVIPWAVSPRDVGMRAREREWRRHQFGDRPEEGRWKGESRSRKGWSWNGRSGARDVELWRSAGSEDEAERQEDGWEVLR